MKKIFALLVLLPAFSIATTAEQYLKPPKLVVVLVIDQFRGDLLTRHAKDFMPAGTNRKPGGFRFLMDHGAWFPFAEYTALQDMTCPGHATILTGSNPASHGIGVNEWYSTKSGKNIYCAQDDKDGLSPRRLMTTTVGDELKNMRSKSKVIAIALKDRSAIMLGGHNADHAIWMEEDGHWSTSSYYKDLPEWVKKINEGLKLTKKNFDPHEVGGAKAGEDETIRLALAAVKNEKLGHGPSTDLLAISLSNHDILSHKYGPDSDQVIELTKIEDHMVADLINGLKKEISLDDVIIAFTADHGTPPVVENALANHLEAGRIDMKALIQRANDVLSKKYGMPADTKWIVGDHLFHIFLNHEFMNYREFDSRKVEDDLKKFLLEEKGLDTIFTRADYDRGIFPPGLLGEQVKNSYVPNQSGDVVLIPKPFFYIQGASAVTHMTSWSYDRSVPLILWGKPFKAGVYSGAKVVDLAPTLTFVLNTLPPAKNEGRVLSEIIR